MPHTRDWSKGSGVPHQRGVKGIQRNYCPVSGTPKWCGRDPKGLQLEVGVRPPRGWSGKALEISRGPPGAGGGRRTLLTERISSARAHCSAFTFGIRAGWGGGEGPRPPARLRREDAGRDRGRGGDEVAADVAAVAPRPGPAVQPGSRRNSS